MKWRDDLAIDLYPTTEKDWLWEFGDWLAAGDSIQTHSAVADTGLTVDSSAIEGDDVRVWLSGGTAGESYTVTVTIVTAAGRTEPRPVCFNVIERECDA